MKFIIENWHTENGEFVFKGVNKGDVPYSYKYTFDKLYLVGVENIGELNLTEHFKSLYECAMKWRHCADDAKEKLNRVFAWWWLRISIRTRQIFPTDIPKLEENCKLWNHIRSICKTYTIDEHVYPVKKLRLDFTSGGVLKNKDTSACFPNLCAKQVKLASGISETEKKCGNMLSIPAIVRQSEGIWLIGQFDKELIGFFTTEYEEAHFLFEAFQDIELEKVGVVQFLGFGYDAIREKCEHNIKEEKNIAKLSFKTYDDGTEKSFALNEMFAKKFKQALYITRRGQLQKTSKRPREPRPYATEAELDAWRDDAEGGAQDKVQQRSVKRRS